MKALERTIAARRAKEGAQAQALEPTDALGALRLHNVDGALTAQLAEAEERWFRLQEEMDSAK